MRYGCLGEVEHRVDVDAEGQFPFLVRDVFDRGEGCLVRCVVDKDIDAAEFAHRPFDDIPAMVRRLDIAGDENRLPARLLDPFPRLLGILVLVEIGDEDIGAFAGIGYGDGAPDPAIGTGDDGLLAGQAP
jgi:hypothetical protein